jgi:UDP-N-acetylglucosamine--N-acetylmuramyl-(pentapeptide) pyrophosphoryl-undecaprenol N-acetylglucosamine transferase
LGALSINESILNGLSQIKAAGLQLIWQTGKGFDGKAAEAVKTINDTGIQTFAFIKEMDLAYAAADIVISRAGALSIAELAIVGKPTILVPSPNVSEDHQTKNALALVEKDAALFIKDIDAKEELVPAVLGLLVDTVKQKQLSANIKALAITDAAERIVDELLALKK